jgi:hypothetical protein
VHDGINCMIVVDSRCERLGAPSRCEVCEGHGIVGTPEQRETYENWVSPEPPTGDGWQMWETVTEGSPQTPVFATAEELADYCAEHATVFGRMRWTAAEWLASFTAGTTDTDSLLMITVPREEQAP